MQLIGFFLAFISTHINANNLITDNKTAYTLIALAAQDYLNYTYGKGATGNACSPQGKKICALLSKLREKTRLFSNPTRDDLKELSKQAAINFRNFDLSGNSSDRKTFVQSLINALQAVLPLLENDDNTECRSLIQQLSKTI